ncbi:hypothetical protein EB796_007354 [Bugula neritina]|uniref:Uncharacterized protein n=1 Tax=Bugula neritina TaxID=10212 RepID=A0A7J7K6T5_BUGNE|nr:hypothetical protein EB796_007354 [Bugula neritina]
MLLMSCQINRGIPPLYSHASHSTIQKLRQFCIVTKNLIKIIWGLMRTGSLVNNVIQNAFNVMVINVKCIEAFIPCIHMLLNAVQKLRHSPKFS